MEITTLTSDRFFLLTFFFWMFAGTIIVFPIAMLAITVPQIIWGPRNTAQINGFLTSLGIFLVALLVAYGAFRLGLRDREVVLTSEKNVEIRWGVTVPFTLRRYSAAALTDFTITNEKRIALSARSSGHYGSRNMADRWRLTAQVGGKRVDLGSYETEAAAQAAIAVIQAATN